MLFNITNFNAAISASFCFGHSSGIDVHICFVMSMMAVLVGMFVYMEMVLEGVVVTRRTSGQTGGSASMFVCPSDARSQSS